MKILITFLLLPVWLIAQNIDSSIDAKDYAAEIIDNCSLCNVDIQIRHNTKSNSSKKPKIDLIFHNPTDKELTFNWYDFKDS